MKMTIESVCEKKEGGYALSIHWLTLKPLDDSDLKTVENWRGKVTEIHIGCEEENTRSGNEMLNVGFDDIIIDNLACDANDEENFSLSDNACNVEVSSNELKCTDDSDLIPLENQLEEAAISHFELGDSPASQITYKMIRDKISMATILQIVSTAKSLRFLYVRRNVILNRCDRYWENISDWSMEQYQWIKINSRSDESTERKVSKILGYRWHMLSKKEFKSQSACICNEKGH